MNGRRVSGVLGAPVAGATLPAAAAAAAGSEATSAGASYKVVGTPSDVEVSPDGTVWVSDNSALAVKRFDANGKLLKSIKAGPSAPVGIGVDLDCNLWVTDI